MRKNMTSKLSKIAIIFCSIVLTVVLCYEPFANGMTEESDALSDITLPESTISKVDYLSSSDDKQTDSAALTIEAYIEPQEKVEKVIPSDIMVVFDESVDANESRSDVLNGIKNVIDKLPDSEDKDYSHRVCLLGCRDLENTGYYTYDNEVKFNEPIPDVSVWKEYSDDSSELLPTVLRKYTRSLPSYDKCFLSKTQAIEVLNQPDRMNKWDSEESRADAGLVLAGKFIKKRNMALNGEKRKSRPLIVIFAASSMPTQIVNGEKISRAESIKAAKNQIILNCENYGVTPNFYSIGDCNAGGFDEMMVEVAGGANNRFSLDNFDKLSKKIVALTKSSEDQKNREIEITTSAFKDSNGEEKSFEDLKNQYNFDFDKATITSYSLTKNSNGEENWIEDTEKISEQKVSAGNDVLSCRLSIDKTAELATYNTESGTTTTVGPPRKVIIEITTVKTSGSTHPLYIHVRSMDEYHNDITENFNYYLKYFSGDEYQSWYMGSSGMAIKSDIGDGSAPLGWEVEQLGNSDYEPTEAWLYNGPFEDSLISNIPSDPASAPEGWQKISEEFQDASNESLSGMKVNVKISYGTTLNGTEVVEPTSNPEYTLIFKNKEKKADRNIHLELGCTMNFNIPKDTTES